MPPIQFVFAVPEGRSPASRKRDCVIRAICLAAERPYDEVCHAIASHAQRERPRGNTKRSSATAGVFTNRAWFKEYMNALGFQWTPTMKIGTGCRVHLRRDELPSGRLVCMVSHHACAVIDGVLFDNHDSSRNGTRCVYGYWRKVA
jgi:hypothetical protein